MLTCKIKKNKEESKLKINYEIEYSKLQLRDDYAKIENDNENLRRKILELKAENKIYKKDHETITSIAKQPKICNNNNNNNIYNLSVYDDNIIKDRFALAINNVKASDIYGGQSNRCSMSKE